MLVELARVVMQRVNPQRPDAGILSDGFRPCHRIQQQRASQLQPACSLIHRQPPQHEDGDRVGHVAADCARCGLMGHGAGGVSSTTI